jgi:hypothetical protein
VSAVLTEAMADLPSPRRTSARGSLSRATVTTAEAVTTEDGTDARCAQLPKPQARMHIR